MASRIAQLRNVAALTTMTDQLINAPIGQERMGCFFGPSGFGKTFAVSAVQIMYDVIAVEVMENTSKHDVLSQLVDQLGLKVRRDVPARIRAVAAFMSQTNRPLVIDDAQYLIKRGMIGLARDIYKNAGGVVPVILVGEEKLPDDLKAFENIQNRIAVWHGAEPCTLEDARRLAAVYAEDVDVEEPLLSEFVLKASGNIRRVTNMLGAARDLARANGTNRVGLTDWGNRPFFDGSPPIARDPSQLRPDIMLVAPGPKRAAGS